MSPKILLRAGFVVLIAVILVIAYFYAEALINPSYYWGRGAQPWYVYFFGFPVRVVMPVLIGDGVIIILAAMMRLKFKWDKFVLCFLSVIFATAGLNSNPFARESGPQAFVRGFLDMAKDRLMPGEVESWALSLIATTSTDENVRFVKKHEIIPSILNLYPDRQPSVTVEKGVGENWLVRVDYGGGFRHWGLIVQKATTGLNSEIEAYYLPWTERIYAYHFF